MNIYGAEEKLDIFKIFKLIKFCHGGSATTSVWKVS